MITAKQCADKWAMVAGTGVVVYESYAKSSPSWAKAWEAVAALANEKPAVPRMIHEAFWKAYFQWADGLEKMLRSEQSPEPLIIGRLELEYQAACKRLETWTKQFLDQNYGVEELDPIELSRQAAIPARK